MNPETSKQSDGTVFDVIVVGAGAGGIYATHRFSEQGLAVLGIEAAAEVGGVWYHNRYPGARVDVESYYYCYFDEALYREWTWTERYPAQPEILAYLNFAADRYDIRRLYRFSTWMTGADWSPAENRWHVRTDSGETYSTRFLVMTTGQLSKPRPPQFAGLESFRGEWVQTAQWPDRDVELDGKRIGVVGTGSSGVQVIPELAKKAKQLFVFQRTPNFSVPAQNRPTDQEKYDLMAADMAASLEFVLDQPIGWGLLRGSKTSAELSEAEQLDLLETRWAHGGHTMNTVFTDQSRDQISNDIVAEFVRSKVRGLVDDPTVAEQLVPVPGYPIGARRLCVDTDYYVTYNRDNVTLVDVKSDPIVRITPNGIATRDAEYDLDLIVFATGFEAFTGALDNAQIRNEAGESPSDRWTRGPRTYLGLMTRGFPNLFIVTGPGSPSVLANMIVANQQHVDFISGLIAHLAEHGGTRVEPSEAAQDDWTAHSAQVASGQLRLNVPNYMVHVNTDDDSKVFIPYAGGMDQYVRRSTLIAENGYEGFELS